MILYSIVPVEVVFSACGGQEEMRPVEMEYLGEKVQVMPAGNNNFIICRIISTSPKAFLNPQLQPGTVIYGQ